MEPQNSSRKTQKFNGINAPRALMHARHLLGMLAIVLSQNSFEFSRTLRSQGVPLNIVPSMFRNFYIVES